MTDQTLETRDPLEPFVLDGHRIMVGDLVLDLALHTIYSHSMQTVKLSKNEFVLLATLIKSCGRFVSRTDLLEAVCGAEVDPHPSVIDTYIKYLRRQLQQADSSATIEKSVDEGFRLIP